MTAPYLIKLWSPFTATYETADNAIMIKAPEIGNTETKARNQSIARTRSGNSMVYDRGRNFNEVKKMQFRSIQDTDKAALQVFLETVQWGSTKLMYEDWQGNQMVIRVNTTQLEYIDQGFMDRNNVLAPVIVWDFDLEFLDLSNNIDELEGNDTIVSNALTLHITNLNHPHNPATSYTATTTIGTVEQFLVDDWSVISWHILLTNGANKAHGFLHAVNNGTPSADATSIDTVLEVLNDPTGLFSTVTFAADLSGTLTAQVMRLRATAASGSVIVKVRRFKL
jgi:hypothetical protein